jgi:hypothetical protein
MSKVQRKHVNLYKAGCVIRLHKKLYFWTKPERFHDTTGQYPFTYYVYDPPIYVPDLVSWGLCSEGVTYFQSGGIWHAQKVIGRDNYPNTADVLEEWLNGWASTLVPMMGEGLKLLTPGKSRLLIYHGGGWIDEYKDYRDDYISVLNREICMLPNSDPRRSAHLDGEDMCASLHWQHVTGGDREKRLDRRVERTIGQCTYPAVMPIDGEEPTEHYALVAWRPIDELHLVDTGIDDNAIQEAIDWLTGATGIPAQLPIFVTDN